MKYVLKISGIFLLISLVFWLYINYRPIEKDDLLGSYVLENTDLNFTYPDTLVLKASDNYTHTPEGVDSYNGIWKNGNESYIMIGFKPKEEIFGNRLTTNFRGQVYRSNFDIIITVNSQGGWLYRKID